MALVLTGNINPAAYAMAVTGAVPDAITPGFVFALDNEVLQLLGFGSGRPPNTLPVEENIWLVQRGVGGSVAASHTAGASILAVTNGWAKSADLTQPSPFPAGSLSADIVAGLEAAASPSGKNPFATMADVGDGVGALTTATVELSTAEIAEGVTKAGVIAALGAGMGANIVTADFIYVLGTVPFAVTAAASLQSDAGSVYYTGDADATKPASTRTRLAVFDDPPINLAELVNLPIDLVLAAAGYAGGILTSELAAAGTNWLPGDEAVVTADTEPISAVNQGTKTFTVQAGITVGLSDRCYVKGSTGNDGFYTIVSVSGNDVTVAEAIPDATGDGDMYHGSAQISVDTVDNAFPITAVNTGAKTLTIAGNHAAAFGMGDTLTVFRSTGNDGDYTVATSTFDTDHTDIVVVEAVPDATVDGGLGNATTGDIGVIATYTLDEAGTAYRVGGSEYILGGPGGPGDDTSLNPLTVSEDSDGTGRVAIAYYSMDMT